MFLLSSFYCSFTFVSLIFLPLVCLFCLCFLPFLPLILFFIASSSFFLYILCFVFSPRFLLSYLLPLSFLLPLLLFLFFFRLPPTRLPFFRFFFSCSFLDQLPFLFLFLLLRLFLLVPPRAWYFDVVGGLACCYDGLGFNNVVGSFLPDRFNLVVQASLEHPD